MDKHLEKDWKQFTERLVVDFCNKRGMRTFSLKEFKSEYEDEILSFSEDNNNPFAKIRQQLQMLRNDEILSFVDNRGTYTLRRPIILEGELEDDAPIKDEDGLSEPKSAFDYEGKASNHTYNARLEKYEYTVETYARNRGWVKQAKDRFGHHCLHPQCRNSFLKPDGELYIEVHHIVPLFQGGEDALCNLSVVCAHHHRMAHFAENIVKEDLQKLFLGIVSERLQA